MNCKTLTAKQVKVIIKNKSKFDGFIIASDIDSMYFLHGGNVGDINKDTSNFINYLNSKDGKKSMFCMLEDID